MLRELGDVWHELTLLNSTIQGLLGFGLVGALTALWRTIAKRNKLLDTIAQQQEDMKKDIADKQTELFTLLEDTDRRLDGLEAQGELRRRASLATLHDRVYSAGSEILARGYITLKEMNNLEHLFEAYHEQGGNGTAEALYNKVLALQIKTTDDKEEHQNGNDR